MNKFTESFTNLITDIQSCQRCADLLPLTPNPIIQASQESKILIIGQAPGLKTHHNNKPFDDQSGERLRLWLQVSEQEFYNDKLFAIMPMAFCYPGKNKTGSGDAPPPKICQQTWHQKLLNEMTEVQLTIYIGSYAVKHYMPEQSSLNDAINHADMKNTFALPHPSPRNNIWLSKNKEFETKTLPRLRQRLMEVLSQNL